MANSKQLSFNNLNNKIRKNENVNTENIFKKCVSDIFGELHHIYPNYIFKHENTFKNTSLIEILSIYGITNIHQCGTINGGCSPDGGIIYIKTKKEKYLPVFIGENKWQANNPGNALERAVKNIIFFQHCLIDYNYFPYFLNLNGDIVDDNFSKGNYFDRITMVGGFMPINEIFVISSKDTPRIRLFHFL